MMERQKGKRGRSSRGRQTRALVQLNTLTRELLNVRLERLGRISLHYLSACHVQNTHIHTHSHNEWTIASFALPGVLRSGDPSGNLSSPCKRKCQLSSARGCSVASRLRLPAQLCTTVSRCDLDLSCATSKSDGTFNNNSNSSMKIFKNDCFMCISFTLV